MIKIVKKSQILPKYEKDGIDSNSQWILVGTREITTYILCVNGKPLPGEEWYDKASAFRSLRNDWTKDTLLRKKTLFRNVYARNIKEMKKELKQKLKKIDNRLRQIEKYCKKVKSE